MEPFSPVMIAVQLSLALLAWIAYKLVVLPLLSPLRHIPGPPSSSLIFGNIGDVIKAEPGVPHRAWAKAYGAGGVIRYRGFFGEDRLLFTDPTALTHILVQKSYQYPKPQEIRGMLSGILGAGIFFAEGEDHRRQKKTLAPAFSPTALRELTPVFFEYSYKLRDLWTELIETDSVDGTAFASPEKLQQFKNLRQDKSEIVIDVLKWLSRATLDIIGSAGFGYDFLSLDMKDNLLGDAVTELMGSSITPPSPWVLSALRLFGPVLATFPSIISYAPVERIKTIRSRFKTIDSECRLILEHKKREVAEAGSDNGGRKDLITLLLKANSADAKNAMSDAELMGQMTSFILAGHETTSTSLMWTLYQLARSPAIQSRLRDEVRQARRVARDEGRGELGSDELSGLEYMDAVCREVLRFENPVSATIREASEDDIIPLSTPFKDRTGSMVHSVPVRAGQPIVISLATPNFSTAVFGEDAVVFRPERWLEGHVGEKEQGVGVFSHLLSFLAGPRACIGYKFSIMEMKAILSVLIDSFEFDEREPGLPMTRRSAIVTRALVTGEEELGFAMPLRVKLAHRDD